MENAETSSNDTSLQARDNSDIDNMVRAKTILQSCVSKPPEYSIIQQLIDEYIMKYCEHNIIYDSIDITPDTSKTIRYCTHCYTDFPHP